MNFLNEYMISGQILKICKKNRNSIRYKFTVRVFQTLYASIFNCNMITINLNSLDS